MSVLSNQPANAPGGGLATPAGPISKGDASISTNTLQTGETLVAGPSAQLIGANANRHGLAVSVDSGAPDPVYLLLGPGVASETNFHIELSPGGSWDGTITGVLWTGAVQFYSAAAGSVGVTEV